MWQMQHMLQWHGLPSKKILYYNIWHQQALLLRHELLYQGFELGVRKGLHVQQRLLKQALQCMMQRPLMMKWKDCNTCYVHQQELPLFESDTVVGWTLTAIALRKGTQLAVLHLARCAISNLCAAYS